MLNGGRGQKKIKVRLLDKHYDESLDLWEIASRNINNNHLIFHMSDFFSLEKCFHKVRMKLLWGVEHKHLEKYNLMGLKMHLNSRLNASHNLYIKALKSQMGLAFFIFPQISFLSLSYNLKKIRLCWCSLNPR